MGGIPRFTYFPPGDTTDPNENNLLRWATQPPVGFFMRGSNPGATVVPATTWTQLGLPQTTATNLIDPNNMVDRAGTGLFTFREPGIYWAKASVFADGGVAAAGDYHCSIAAVGLTPNGTDALTSPLYNFVTVPAGGVTGVWNDISGYIIVTQTMMGNGQNVQRVMSFCPTARNVRTISLYVTLWSKTIPGKF